jgi:ABC-2 type transport system permease protein
MFNRHIYGMFLRKNGRLAVAVSVVSGFLFFLLAALFPDMDPHEAELISASWPDVMKGLFGDPALAFADIYAWLNLQVFHITSWAIYGVTASILSARVIAQEREEKTLELLLSCPVSRVGVLVSGTTGICTLMCLSLVPGIVGCGLGVIASGEALQWYPLLLAGAACLCISMVFGAISLLISACGGSQTLSISVTLAFFSLFFLHSEMLSALIPVLKHLLFANPFRYYRVDDILILGRYECPALLFSALQSLVLLSVAGVVFSRRDIS